MSLQVSLRHQVGRWAFALITTLALCGISTAQKYEQKNLVSDVPKLAVTLDPNLVNAWGIDFSGTSPVWIADNGTGLSTLYTGTGSIVPLVVTIPSGSDNPSAPTGLVFNGTGLFSVKAHDLSGSAVFIFDSEDGIISGWNPNVNLHKAIIAVNNSDKGAVYKALAIGTNDNGSFIYATNFHSGWVEMYDSNFKWVKNFTDTSVPMGYAPFGARVLNGKLYVTFALQDADAHDDVSGPGHGFIDIFDLDGNKIKRLTSHGALNSPWGLAIAPANFGQFSNALLVGNFGNGHINAFDPSTGTPLGHMLRPSGATLEISGLWGLHFGNGEAAGPTNTLLFTAGPQDESHGLFGTITLPGK
ncbi:MAG: TIGR03118 family protein [Acidobacteria bacterium]|nr:MAG: TIGR03118 family protein [Acidobacteriota bacterium]PYV74856.1 MAG: TIGR03118 family protein [Acidobacteriota bacterium]PYV78096.1 MAG: TIGR03118 family protein [Acidobacteriota bacterium]